MTSTKISHQCTTTRRTKTSLSSFCLLAVLAFVLGTLSSSDGGFVVAFQPLTKSPSGFSSSRPVGVVRQQQHRVLQRRNAETRLSMAGQQVSEKDAKKAIDTVVKALRKDGAAKKELGNLSKVENVLGYGSPRAGKLAVRFNASFKKGGSGFLGMGGGNKDAKEQRGTMVGQVKASVDATTGKVVECSVFRDLGYGRAFNLKT